MREHDVKKIIYCPVCGNKFHKALYDFNYIHCNDGCRTVFDKETGKILGLNNDFSKAHKESVSAETHVIKGVSQPCAVADVPLTIKQITTLAEYAGLVIKNKKRNVRRTV